MALGRRETERRLRMDSPAPRDNPQNAISYKRPRSTWACRCASSSGCAPLQAEGEDGGVVVRLCTTN